MLVIDSPSDLDPIITATVTRVLELMQVDSDKIGDRIALSESAAAKVIDLETHQLRDERRRGRIGFTTIVGGRIRYTRADLIDYLQRNRIEVRT